MCMETPVRTVSYDTHTARCSQTKNAMISVKHNGRSGEQVIAYSIQQHIYPTSLEKNWC
ncbi:hypothetical protein Hanom_Chr12g01067821 [Helianthus anomalus]